jgi:DNA-binding IclR family transcriptional regulator
MDTLADAGRPISVWEVAEGIGVDSSTAYRMLMTLLEAGYVTRDASLKNYQLGYKLLSLTRNLLNENDRSWRRHCSRLKPDRGKRPLLRS